MHLSHLPADWHHTHLLQTGTTMAELRKEVYVRSSYAFELLTADYQTAGHGQRGTTWEAEAGQNLLFGFVFHPLSVPASKQFLLSEALALAVRSALSVYTDEVTVKWPNDVYWRDQKICGMLLEHTLSSSSITTTLTGVGININQAAFHSDAPNPVSLRQIVGREVERAEVLEKVVEEFFQRYRWISDGHYAKVHEEYCKYLYRGQGLHTYKDKEGTFRASIEDISSMGMLTLRRADGSLHTYAFKEVSFV